MCIQPLKPSFACVPALLPLLHPPPPSNPLAPLAAAYHYLMFFALLGGGLLFLALLLYFTGDIEFQRAVVDAAAAVAEGKVVRERRQQ